MVSRFGSVLSFVATVWFFFFTFVVASFGSGVNAEGARIVWGQEAKEDQFPFMAALYFREQFRCTASIIAEDLLLTAAHCVTTSDGVAMVPMYFTATVGHIDRTNNEFRITFKSIKPHQEYNPNTVEHDIALMSLFAPLIFTKSIQPICLSPANKTYERKSGLAIGWGRDHTFQLPKILQYAEVDVTTLSHCRIAYKALSLNQIEIGSNHICAGSRMKGACNGDYGGPLVLTGDDGERFSAGVASFGSILGCGVLGVPAVYTSTSHYYDWIVENAEPSCVCFAK